MQLGIWCCVFVVIAQVCCVDIPDHYMTKEDALCLARYGIDKKYMEDRMSKELVIIEGDETLNKYIDCWMKESKFMDADGQLNAKLYTKWVETNMFSYVGKPDYTNKEELAAKIVNNCKDVQGSDHGEKAVRIFNCVMPPFAYL